MIGISFYNSSHGFFEKFCFQCAFYSILSAHIEKARKTSTLLHQFLSLLMSISLSFNIGNNPPALLIILFSPLFDIHSYIQFGAVFRVVYFMGSVQSFRHVTCIVQVQMMHISVFPSLYISVYVLFLTPLFYQVPEICSRPKN